MECGILVFHQGWVPYPLHWKHGILTTQPPGKSQLVLSFHVEKGKYSNLDKSSHPGKLKRGRGGTEKHGFQILEAQRC